MIAECDTELGHCSNHTYFSVGCGDCAVTELYRIQYSSKLQKSLKVGIHNLEILPATPGPKLQLVRQQFARKMHIFLVNAASDVSKAVTEKYRELNKADDTKDIAEALFIASLAAIAWLDLVNEVTSDLLEAWLIGAQDGLMQLEIKSKEFVDAVSAAATEYSTSRAAEMVGKRWLEGKLVDSASAKYVISETTRDDLKDIIDSAVRHKLTVQDLKKEIEDSNTFSSTRAGMIARTEMTKAQVQGNLFVWKRSGMIKHVNLVVSSHHPIVDICDDLAKAGPYTLSHVPEVPIHPNCSCEIIAVELTGE